MIKIDPSMFKYTTIAAIGVIAVTLLLTGCDGKETSTPTPLPPPTTTLGDTWTRSKDGMAMVYVPTGEFEMGSSDDDIDYVMRFCNKLGDDCERSWFDNEQPAHIVELDGFWIDKTEVTNAQFAAFLNSQKNQKEDDAIWLEIESDDCLLEQVGDEYLPKQGYADHPVVKVNWYGAKAYCEWTGGRLPTEAEWEYTARGPNGHIFPWGHTFDGERLNFCDVNCAYSDKNAAYDDGYEKTAPVGNYLGGASWCGALDMAGNVWEWTSSLYEHYPYDSNDERENSGSPESRVVHGGSWDRGEFIPLRAAFRLHVDPSFNVSVIGFRCVVEPK